MASKILHMVIAPMYCLRMEDSELVRWFPEWKDQIGELRDALRDMHKRGAAIPNSECDNYDELGRCQGHAKEDF